VSAFVLGLWTWLSLRPRWEIAVAAIRIGVVICPATTLLVDKDIEFRWQKVRSRCPELNHVIQIGDGDVFDDSVVNFGAVLEGIPSGSLIKSRKTKSQDPCLIYFTSGTSGPPKMVRHNHVSYPLGTMPFLTL